MTESNEPYIQIGEMAERAGVTQRTLRFYEEKGLLRPPGRMEGGFRLYSEDDVRRVRQIRRFQDLLGVSLAEIKEIVDAGELLREIKMHWRADAGASEKVQQLQRALEITEKQHQIVRLKVAQMQEMQAQLQEHMNDIRRKVTEIREAAAEASSAKATS